MIVSFADKDTEKLFRNKWVGKFSSIERQARRKLLIIHAAHEIEDLLAPPGNRLEALKGDRKGQHSIRINQQWRICFKWKADGPHDVEIVDYH